MTLLKSNPLSLKICASFLNNGEIVVIPTDTVYGFSGKVEPNVEKKIYAIKGRDEAKPFIRLIAHPSDIFLHTDDKISEKLLSFWPGELTIIVNDKKGGTVAYRCPNDKWLCALIEMCDSPLYSTSVNRSGHPFLTDVTDIKNEFESEVALIIDDGSKNAKPSTIVSVTDGLKIVRQGSLFIENDF